MLVTPASTMTVYPHVYRQLSYNPADLSPVTVASTFVHAFAVGPMEPGASPAGIGSWPSAWPREAEAASRGQAEAGRRRRRHLQ